MKRAIESKTLDRLEMLLDQERKIRVYEVLAEMVTIEEDLGSFTEFEELMFTEIMELIEALTLTPETYEKVIIEVLELFSGELENVERMLAVDRMTRDGLL